MGDEPPAAPSPHVPPLKVSDSRPSTPIESNVSNEEETVDEGGSEKSGNGDVDAPSLISAKAESSGAAANLKQDADVPVASRINPPERKRARRACKNCHARKLRCEMTTTGACTSCISKNWLCEHITSKRRAAFRACAPYSAYPTMEMVGFAPGYEFGPPPGMMPVSACPPGMHPGHGFIGHFSYADPTGAPYVSYGPQPSMPPQPMGHHPSMRPQYVPVIMSADGLPHPQPPHIQAYAPYPAQPYPPPGQVMHPGHMMYAPQVRATGHVCFAQELHI